MRIYRLCRVGDNALAADGDEFICASDEEAMALAQKMVKAGASIWVWQDRKFVGVVSGRIVSCPESSRAAGPE